MHNSDLLPPRFVGRTKELHALTRALDEPPAIVAIEGEAGIGKTRLLSEYLVTRADQRVLVAACPAFRQPQTLGPVVDALRAATDSVGGLGLSSLAGALRSMFPEWEADLPPAPEPAADASAARHRAFRALTELLGKLRVTALVIEDAHWADEATLEFLLFLSSRQPQPVSLVLTYRPYDVPADSLLLRLTSRLPPGTRQLRLALDLLDAETTGRLVSSMLEQEQVSQPFASFLHQHTEGLPLAIEETIRLLADRAELKRRGVGWVRRHVNDLAVPDTIRDAVLERAQRLGDQAQSALRALAVLADPSGEDLVATVTGAAAEDVRAGLAAAVRSGLIQVDRRGLICFRHVLAARVTYEQIPVLEARELHLRAALALEQQSPGMVAQLARHFREAGEHGKWSRYAERAAQRAIDSGDEATASELAEDLLTSAGPAGLDSAARILDQVMFASMSEPARHLQAMVAAVRLLLRTQSLASGQEAVWRYRLGIWLGLLHDAAAARAEMERAIPGLRNDPARTARAMTVLGWPWDMTTTAAEHLRWLRKSAALAASTELDPLIRLRLITDTAPSLLAFGQSEGWVEADKIPLEADSMIERQVITVGHTNRGDLLMIWGRYSDAQRALAVARNLASTYGFTRHSSTIELTQAHLDWFTGSWSGLVERVRSLADTGSMMPIADIEADLVCALLQAASGDHAAAEPALRTTIDRQLRQGTAANALEPAATLAWMRLSERKPAEALATTGGLADVVRIKGYWVGAAELAPVHIAALAADGHDAEAAGYLAAFGRGLRGVDAPAARAALIGSRGILAQSRKENAAAARLHAKAATCWARLPRPYEALLATERQADCLIAAGDRDHGQRLLTGLLTESSDLGAVELSARVARALRQLGVAVRRPGAGRPAYRNRLSPREVEVVRLVASGQTNRQIAQELFLSPTTVTTHVNAAMRKLGVSTRTALAVAALSSGALEPVRP